MNSPKSLKKARAGHGDYSCEALNAMSSAWWTSSLVCTHLSQSMVLSLCGILSFFYSHCRRFAMHGGVSGVRRARGSILCKLEPDVFFCSCFSSLFLSISLFFCASQTAS